jgi:hypothetical protein
MGIIPVPSSVVGVYTQRQSLCALAAIMDGHSELAYLSAPPPMGDPTAAWTVDGPQGSGGRKE